MGGEQRAACGSPFWGSDSACQAMCKASLLAYTFCQPPKLASFLKMIFFLICV